ncbi:MAG: transketolase family protein [Clostridiales bacterium]|nr:transketolase family protein [Clostridiales bacterium]MCF8022894.1 transketolase family protein [Clostridiales bacterium]
MADKISTREAYGKALVELGKENKDVVVLDADLSKSTKTVNFSREFPERFFDMGIAEQNMMGTAAGLAAAGKIPFASTFAVFATGRTYDQVRNSIAYPALNVAVAASHAGITVGEDGASHQALEDIALMRVLPNMTVFVPADGPQTEAAVRAAVEINGPVYIRLGRPKIPVLYGDNFEFIPGKAVKAREGKDVTIIACGLMVSYALEAADQLEKEEGVSAAVLDMHTIKPLDAASIVEAARETGAVVTAEEHSIIGGLGSAVAETLGETLPVPMMRVGMPDLFGESGKPDELIENYGMSASNINAVVKEVLTRKK